MLLTELASIQMTRPRANPPADAAKTAARWLVRITAGAMALTAIVLVLLLALINRAAWWHGMIAGTVISLLAAGLSLAPLVWGVRGGTQRAAIGWLMASAVRVFVSLGGSLLAIYAGHYPPVPTLGLVMPFYFVQLIAESVVLWRASRSNGETDNG